MKWFKHQSDARNSLKLRKVRRKYGSDGYAIYWFCLESIAYDVDKDNLTFDLKEDAETIGFELTIQEKRVEEIMLYMIEIGLFESSRGMITCLKLAESIDKSMTNSPKMRKWLDLKAGKSVMTLPDGVSTYPELEVELEKELEKEKKSNLPPEKKISGKKVNHKFSDEDMRLVNWMIPLIENVSPTFKCKNPESWANTIRLMRESDKLDHKQIAQVFKWANQDKFWKTNIMSASKLREKFSSLDARRLACGNRQQNANDISSVDHSEDF